MTTRPFALLACVLGLLATGCGQTATTPVKLPAKAPGKYMESMASGGHNRTYILHVPAAYDATKPLPLVVLLHGLSGSAADIEAVSGMPQEAEVNGFILVSPDGMNGLGGRGWNAGFFYLGDHSIDDVAFIDSLIDKVETEVGVDPDRVFVAGHSNGAFMAHFLAARLSNKIAAIGAVAGTIGIPDRDGYKQIPNPTGPISVLMLHGKADPMVQYDSSSTALLKDIGAMDSAKWWAGKDGCATTPTETKSPSGNVVTDLFTGGKKGTEVELISIQNGTHDWPGGFFTYGQEKKTGVVATDLIWQFFKSHPKVH